MNYKKSNKKDYAVSNVLGYLLTFSIISLLMVAAVLTTNSVVDSKNISAGEQIAQTLANQIADSFVDIVSLSESNPSTSFDHSLDIPVNLAGREYYIEITEQKTYVNSTDGKISKSCTTYNHNHLINGLHQKIFSDTNKIMFSYTPSPLLYTLDFSKGNSFSHSSVESGSYMITPIIDPLWPEQYESYRYRTPFIIDNTDEHAKDIIDATLSVALDSKSIDYSKTHVQFLDKSDTEVFGSFSEPYAYSDLVFLLYEPSGWTALEYSIDYWNEQGNSLISLHIPQLLKDESMYVFLYYGSDPLIQSKVSFRNTSEFFYDFSDTLDLMVWNTSNSNIEMTDSCVTLSKDEYILTKEYSISAPSVESLYVIESKHTISEGDGSVIAFSNSNTAYTHSYLISLDSSDSNKFLIHKQIGSVSEPSHQQSMDETSVSALPFWLRQKTFLYVNISESLTNITSYIYDYNTYALIPGFVHGSDNNGSAYDTGSIGFGAGLLFDENDNAEVSIDWVRVVKAPHGSQPTIRWGGWETTNCRWNTSSISAAVHNTDIQLQYGPLLSDYHFNGIELREDSPFIVEDEEEQDDEDEEEDDTELRGSGTADDPYQIYNWHHLNKVRNKTSSFFILMNDLDHNSQGYDMYASNSANYGEGWMPLRSLGSSYFTGKFDGRGHTISYLYINRSDTNDQGLFGGINSQSRIENIGLLNVDIKGNLNVGGLIGRIYDRSIISNSYVTGIISGDSNVGGLVGNTGGSWSGGTILNSYSSTTVRGRSTIGGLVGRNYLGTIKKSFSDSNIIGIDTIKGQSMMLGGLAGENFYGTIENTYSAGNAIGYNCVGGLIGLNYGSVVDSYSRTNVQADLNPGGLIGWSNPGLVSNSFYDINTTNQTDDIGNGIGLTTFWMKDYNTFNDEGWDIAKIEDWNGEIWYIDDGVDYPRLGWDFFAGGDGSLENPYQISNWHHLNNIRYNLDQSFVLMNDIDRNSYGYDTYSSSSANGGAGWMPIGNDYETRFSGTFFGQNYIINDLYIRRTDTIFVGLFGYCHGATIDNISLFNVYIEGNDYVGGISGSFTRSSSMNNIFMSGNVTSAGSYVGGLIGRMSMSSLVTNSYSICNITGKNWVGGLTGQIAGSSKITNSYCIGHVNGNSLLGGLSGGISFSSVINNSYFIGETNGGDNNGGLVGFMVVSSEVINSYALADINGDQNAGGLVGYMSASLVSNSYAIGQVTGTLRVGGFIGFMASSYPASMVSDSFARCDITRSSGSSTWLGGFIGQNERCKIFNSFSTGRVYYAGHPDPTNRGFAGKVTTYGGYEMSGNFWDTQTSGQSSTAGDATGKITDEMKLLSTFINQGWDIAKIEDGNGETWYIDDGVDYPCLFWQKKPQPQVETNNATHITETTATLWGTLLDDSGEACAVGFDYGTTPSYGSSSPSQIKNTGESFHYQITDLSPGQLYYYQAYADNSEQRTTGENKVFLSRPLRPAHVNGQINNPTSLTIQWIKGTGSQYTRIQRQTGSYPISINDGVTVYNDTGTSYTDTGLNQGTIYYYSLWSYTSCDTTLLYQYSHSHARIKTGDPIQVSSAEFIIQNIPQGMYSIQITKGDHQTQNDAMTINCNYATENPVLTFSDCNKGIVQTKQFTINKNTDEDIKITFQSNTDFFTVHYIKIYAGEQTLMIKEK